MDHGAERAGVRTAGDFDRHARHIGEQLHDKGDFCEMPPMPTSRPISAFSARWSSMALSAKPSPRQSVIKLRCSRRKVLAPTEPVSRLQDRANGGRPDNRSPAAHRPEGAAARRLRQFGQQPLFGLRGQRAGASGRSGSAGSSTAQRRPAEQALEPRVHVAEGRQPRFESDHAGKYRAVH